MTERQGQFGIGLEARGISCGRGGRVLVPACDIVLAPGSLLLVTGPNGAGKSTLLRTLAGLVAPLSGTIAWTGADPEDPPPLHLLGHRSAVRARLTLLETLAFWAALDGGEGLPLEAGLDRTGLGAIAQLDAGYLSAGQSRRLALARLLVSPRPAWLLDEPTASLDTEGEALVGTMIADHLAQGGIAIAATHLPFAVAGIAAQRLTVGR